MSAPKSSVPRHSPCVRFLGVQASSSSSRPAGSTASVKKKWDPSEFWLATAHGFPHSNASPLMNPICVVPDYNKKMIYVFDAKSLELTYALKCPAGTLRATKVSDDSFAVSDSGSQPCRIRIFDTSTGTQTGLLADLMSKDGTYGLAAMNPERVVSGDRHQHVFVWDVRSEHLVATLPDPPRTTRHIRCVPEWGNIAAVAGQKIGYSSTKGNVWLYDVERLTRVAHLTACSVGGGRAAMDVRREEQLVVVCGKPGGEAIDRRTGKSVVRWNLEASPQRGSVSRAIALYCAPDVHAMVLGIADGFIQVWDDRMLAKRIRTFHPAQSSTIQDIERVAERVFVSVSYSNITSWDLEGEDIRPALKKETKDQSWKYGICAVGTPYDRVQCSSTMDSEAEGERFGFLLQLNERHQMMLLLSVVGRGRGAGEGDGASPSLGQIPCFVWV